MSRPLLLALLLLSAGCQSWHGEAEVRLKDGQTIRCPRGLRFDTNQVDCMGSGISVRWTNVAGYSTR